MTDMEKKGKKGVLARQAMHNAIGKEHPISLIVEKIVSIFSGMGFEVATGPELEDDWHNFEALNFPKDHPARDMQDTFFIKNKPGYVLRTPTSKI